MPLQEMLIVLFIYNSREARMLRRFDLAQE